MPYGDAHLENSYVGVNAMRNTNPPLLVLTLLLGLSLPLYANEVVGSLQRYRFVGMADGGKKVAILLSHFGASSYTPFVTLVVKEVGKPSIEKIDSLFHLGGTGEEILKGLEKTILKDNEKNLKDLGFTPAVVESVPTYWEGTSFEKSPLKMYLDTQNGDGLKILYSKAVPMQCDQGKTGLNWKLCFGDGCAESIAARPEDSCATLSLSQKDVVKIGKAYWTVVSRKMMAIDPLRAVSVEFAGLVF